MTSAAGPDRTGFSRQPAPQARAYTREEAAGAPGAPVTRPGDQRSRERVSALYGRPRGLLAASTPNARTRATWERDLARVRVLLQPYARGNGLYSHEAPEDVSAIYRRLVSVGYARGWM